jgi:hypothetical protein
VLARNSISHSLSCNNVYLKMFNDPLNCMLVCVIIKICYLSTEGGDEIFEQRLQQQSNTSQAPLDYKSLL